MAEMIRLGPIGTGSLRQQTQALIDYLNQAKLEWWHLAKRSTALQQALADFGEQRTPSRLLFSALDEGMKRIAKRYPYVEWKVWERRPLGLWPDRRYMARTESAGYFQAIWVDALRAPQDRYIITNPLGRRQRHWVIYSDTEYGLYTLYGRPLWIVRAPWTHGETPGPCPWVLDPEEGKLQEATLP